MELLEHDAQWFLSKPGCDAFASAKTLEDRSVFLYSYLKQVAPADFDKDQMLFRIAFFFAEAIMGSTLPYNTYPALIDPEKNPFVAYLKNADHYPGAQTTYYVFLSILHGIATPIRQNEWIYDTQFEDPEYLEKKLTELGKCFCSSAVGMTDVDAFDIEESLQPVQLKLIWLMGQI
jgi:hypothetical protein